MKKLLLGTVGLIALGIAPALAADLPARTYTKAPAYVAAVYDWSGFYIGANGGWGTSNKNWDFVTPAGAFIIGEGSHNATGGIVGGQIGYNWQMSSWVFGIEAQGDWANLRGSNISAAFPAFTNRSKIDALGLFTGRVGYAWNNALLYVKGGAGVVNDKFDSVTTVGGVLAGSAGTQTRWGGAVGAGFEYGFTPNWSFAVEYDHVWLDTKQTTFTTPAGALFGNDRIRQDLDLVTARINYRWGGPVVAKY
jgi:outer membrane immunogenic protein